MYVAIRQTMAKSKLCAHDAQISMCLYMEVTAQLEVMQDDLLQLRKGEGRIPKKHKTL